MFVAVITRFGAEPAHTRAVAWSEYAAAPPEAGRGPATRMPPSNVSVVPLFTAALPSQLDEAT